MTLGSMLVFLQKSSSAVVRWYGWWDGGKDGFDGDGGADEKRLTSIPPEVGQLTSLKEQNL